MSRSTTHRTRLSVQAGRSWPVGLETGIRWNRSSVAPAVSQAPCLMESPMNSALRRSVVLVLPMLGIIFGVITALSPGLALALVAVPVVALMVLFPEKSALALLPMTPFYNVLVIRLGGVADIRAFEVAWLGIGLGLLAKLVMGKSPMVGRVPSWIIVASVSWLAAQTVGAIVGGLGVMSAVEVVQSVYLVTLGLVGAACVCGATAERVRRLRSDVLVVFLLVSLWSLLQMFIPAIRAPQLVASIPGGVFVDQALVKTQVAAGAISLSRFALLNLGPVASAGYAVWILGMTASTVIHPADQRQRRLAIIACAVSGLALAGTFSRAGWLAGIAVLLVVIGFAGLGRAFWGSIAVSLLLVGLSYTPWVSARAAELTDRSEDSFVAHIEMWDTSIDMFESRPLTGWGPGAFRYAAFEHGYLGPSSEPHNYILQEAAEAGVVGAVAVMVLTIGVGFWMSARLRTLAPDAFGMGVGLLAVFAVCLTQNGFRTELTWAPYAVTLGMALRASHRADSPQEAEKEV